MNESTTCFVDANVLIYAVNPAEPMKMAVAVELLDRLWRDQRVRTSVQAVDEFYSVVTRRLSHAVPKDMAWGKVEEFLRWDPQPVDSTVLMRARSIEQRYRINWWDCLIVASASVQGCGLLYTEDLQHGGSYDGVRVANPFILGVQEEPAVYHVERVSPHRPRGRPRKQVLIAT